MKRTLSLAFAAVLAASSLAACGAEDEADEAANDVSDAASEAADEVSEGANDAADAVGDTLSRVTEQGTLRVGTKFDQPGFGLKGLSGEPEGFDVEVAKIIAADLGVDEDKIEWVEAPSKVREELIESGKVDMVVATYTINDKRKERITFAGPYYVAGQQVMVAKDNTTINGPESLKDNADAKVCSVTGSTPAEKIKEYVSSEDQIVLFDVYDKCVDALRQGQVDAVTTDNVVLLGYVANSDGAFKLVGEKFTEEPYGIGVAKGDVEFCEAVQKALKDNEDEYVEAWNSTAGQFEGAAKAELPEFDTCA